MNRLLEKKSSAVPLINYLFMISAIAIAILFVIINIKWITEYRINQAIDMDEAGYLAIAFSDYYAWLSGGPAGWLHKVLEPSIQSPITTAVSSLIFFASRPSTLAGFSVPVLFGAGSIFLSYFIARRIAGEWFALLATIVVATSPYMVGYSRTFNFAMAATFCTTAAMLCLVSSQEMRSRRWSIGLGFCVGLMVIARTVTLAFYPAIMLAVLWCVFSRRERLGTAFINAVIAGIVAVLTAASWLAFTWRPVFDYLTSFGYGEKAASYGPTEFWESVRITLQIAAKNFQLTDTLIILAGLAALLVSTLIATFRDGWRATSAALLASPIAPLCIFTAGAMMALMSSSNKGTGFAVPLAPSLIIIAIYGFQQLFPLTWLRVSGSGALALASVVAALPLVSMAAPFYRNAMIDLPVIRWMPSFSSRAPIHWYLDEAGLGDKNIPTAVSGEESRQWYELGRTITHLAKDRIRPDTAIKFGLRIYPLTGNHLVMLNWLDSGTYLPVDQAPPFPGTVADYEAWIKSKPGCVLISASGTAGDFPPAVDTAALEQAARNAGFTIYDTIATPNGREIRLWSRPCS